MYELYSTFALVGLLAGCVAFPTDQAANLAANASETPQTPVENVTTVDIADFKGDRRCENLTRPGTRIVVAQRCAPIDEEALADQLHQVRREQDELDRLAKEREAQRRSGSF